MEKDRPNLLASPLRTFLALAAIISIAEAVVMFLLPLFLPDIYTQDPTTAIADALLLTILVAPFLWWFVARPLRSTAMMERARATTVISNAMDGVITINEQGLVESFNPGAERIFGYRKEEIVGTPLTSLIPERYREAHRKALEAARVRGQSEIIARTLELHGLRKNGGEFSLELTISSWRSEKKLFFTSIMRDISERKRIEQETERNHARQKALREINEAITSTLELRSMLALLLEKIDTILPYAASAVRLFDPTTGALSYRAVRNIDEGGLAKSYKQSGSGLAELVLEANRPLTIPNIETEITSELGKFLVRQGFVSYLGLPLTVKKEALGVLSVLTREEHTFSEEEMGFLKALAGLAAMAIHNSQLYEEAKRLAVELKKAKELEADFAAMIAHDLRSPLTSVLSTAAMMEDGLFGPVGEEQQRWLVKMQTMCRSLVDLVSDFLDLSKIEAGHVQLSKERVDLEKLIRGNAEAYMPLASKKKIRLIEQVAPNLPAVEADPRRLDQILQNLISNAIKFTPEGGKIEVGAGQEDGTEIKLWVKDTGGGIPPEELGPLFQKYRQTTSGMTSKDKGTGLGLVICKMIVEAHGGRIEVESAPGKGSTFTVRLPVNRQ
jgi:PAS domain S-box-containing protein